MKLDELQEDELLAFMALLKQLIRADGELSESEVDHLAALGEALGEERWQRSFGAVKGRFKSKSDIPELAAMVTRAEARICIHKALSTVAHSDSTTKEEAEILNALDTLWGLQRRRGVRRRRSLIK